MKKTSRLEQLRRCVRDWPEELVLITDQTSPDDLGVRRLTVNKLASTTGREPFVLVYNESETVDDDAYWEVVCKRAREHFNTTVP